MQIRWALAKCGSFSRGYKCWIHQSGVKFVPPKNTKNRPGGLKFDTPWRVQVAVLYLQKPHFSKNLGVNSVKKFHSPPNFPENSFRSLRFGPSIWCNKNTNPLANKIYHPSTLTRFRELSWWKIAGIFLGEQSHQQFQVPKMEVLNLRRLFWWWLFPYISLIYSFYRWVPPF